MSIDAKDANGRPVAAEIALGLVDESVKYIQQDYAGDPRQFYYGTKRTHMVQTQSTFNQKPYARLTEVDGAIARSQGSGETKDEKINFPAARLFRGGAGRVTP